MHSIAFVDSEIDPETRRILDIGCIKNDGTSFRSPSIVAFTNYLRGTEFICGHNILNHDIKYLQNSVMMLTSTPATSLTPCIFLLCCFLQTHITLYLKMTSFKPRKVTILSMTLLGPEIFSLMRFHHSNTWMTSLRRSSIYF